MNVPVRPRNYATPMRVRLRCAANDNRPNDKEGCDSPAGEERDSGLMTLLQVFDTLAAYAPLGLLALVVFLAFIKPVAAVMSRFGWLDRLERPSYRQSHVSAVPLAGGAGIVLAVLVAGACALHAPGTIGAIGDSLADLRDASATGLALGAFIVFVVALIDDRKPIRPRWRLVAQAVAATIAIAGGTYITDLGELLWAAQVPLPVWFAVPFTVFAMCGVINAVNMIDGVDGLAGGLAFVAIGWFSLILALIARTEPVAAALLPLAFALAGALAGFLLLNLRAPWRARAAIFMGDAGSMTLGFVLGWLAVHTTQAFGEFGPPAVVALWILAVPLMDTISCMLRRLAHGIRLSAPDHRHLHHLLPATGLSIRRSVVIIIAIALVMGGLGIVGWQAGVPDWAMFWAWVTLFVVYHFAALRFWATQPEDPLAPPPELRRYPLQELRRRLGQLAGAGRLAGLDGDRGELDSADRGAH